jgi:flavin-dependent dehydrogenase
MSISANSESSENIDTNRVVVVGGGPAGCAAAKALAHAGLPVTLVERDGANRDKSCGDMFMPGAVAIIKRLGLSRQNLLSIGASFEAVDLLGPRGFLRKIMFRAESVWILPRRLIDQALRDCLSADVSVLYNIYVNQILKPANTHLQVCARAATGRVIQFRCDAVVLATGAQNALPAQWGIAGVPIIAPSLSAYVRNPGFKTLSFEFLSACRPGYRWLFPAADDQANVGVCSLIGAKGSELRKRGGHLLDAYHLADGVRWRGGVGALWSGRGTRWHHDAGVVACGDAAGLADPITGEGLTAALTSGWAAGTAVANFLTHKRDASWLENYTNRVRATFAALYATSPQRTAWRQLCGVSGTPRRQR